MMTIYNNCWRIWAILIIPMKKLWKEITDQAMWLGNTMDPTAAAGSEIDFTDYLGP